MTVSAPSLRDRLAASRHDRFVGRGPELDRFRTALSAAQPLFHAVHVHGPGGIGKTALLDEYRRICDAAGVPVARIDGRDVDAAPAAVTQAVADAFGGEQPRGPAVLLVDTYEALVPLDDWFRQSFVLDLPDTWLVVFAGRHAPAPEWRAEWGGEVRIEALGALAPAESEAYLAGRGVPPEAQAGVLAFTRGHPLALALVADRYGQPDAGTAPPLSPTEAPDVVRALLDRFVAAAPSPAHRRTLEAAGVVRSLTEPLLTALLRGDEGRDDEPGVHELFAWLRSLSITEPEPEGLRLHDLVRDLVETDLRWRDPARHAALHARARRFYTDHLRAPLDDPTRRRTLGDYVHLYRKNPIVRPLLSQLREAWAEADLEGSGPPAPGEAEVLRAAVARHEGDAAARAIDHWLSVQPEAFEVFRERGGGVAGFLLTLRLDRATPQDRAADPGVAAAWGAVGDRLRPGEQALFFRSWMDADAHQGVSAVQSLAFARTVQLYLSTPDLAVSLLACAEPDLWAPAFGFAGLQRWPSADFQVGETTFAVFGKDWRAVPPAVWLETLAGREPAATPSPEAPSAEALVVLDEDAFADAVREALKAYARPHRLGESPLVQARVVRARPEADGAEALQALIAEAAEELCAGPRERPYFRALDLTYLRPAPTQAIAAERLGLPFSTYRRHLRRGVEHVVEALWRREIGG